VYIAPVPAALEPTPELISALAHSVLSDVPPDALRPLIESAWIEHVPAGAYQWRSGDPPQCGLLVSGLVRMFMLSPDGREATWRYARPGHLSGVALVLLRKSRAAPRVIGGAQAVVDTTILSFDVPLMRSTALTSAPLALALGTQLALFYYDLLAGFADAAFGSVRQRVARHLLDVAIRRRETLYVPMSQQALADAAGTTREVTARALADLRSAGLISTARRNIQLLDPIGLAAEIEIAN
jgi:CRP/FNR family cyclic AMP-dependent transcriptional regulator